MGLYHINGDLMVLKRITTGQMIGYWLSDHEPICWGADDLTSAVKELNVEPGMSFMCSDGRLRRVQIVDNRSFSTDDLCIFDKEKGKSGSLRLIKLVNTTKHKFTIVGRKKVCDYITFGLVDDIPMAWYDSGRVVGRSGNSEWCLPREQTYLDWANREAVDGD